jgi:DNA-binding LacI/PurR family transcriptional regulator
MTASRKLASALPASGSGGQEGVPVAQKTNPLHRVTIADIALRAGVSKGAVSYALNGRPGISEVTRQRILKIADELGWYPNSAARALSGARAGACGLVLARPAQTLAFEPFFMELIAGIEMELSRRSVGLTLQVAHDLEAEMTIYRRWWAERRVDGVLVVDPRVVDPRFELIEKLGLPAVVIGGPEGIGGLSAVCSDDAGAVVDVVRYLARLGHERIARVAGVPEFQSTQVRTDAYLATMEELLLPPRVVTTDFMAESGGRVTRQLLADPLPPTAIVYDSEVLAVAGLGAAHEMGLSVPRDVSLVAWDDSTYCQVVHPPLTAVKRDIPAMGTHGASALLALIDSGVITRTGEARGQLITRGTTARPPHNLVATPRGGAAGSF